MKMTPMSDDPDFQAWHVIEGRSLLEMLRRCRAGESPDLVLLEAYANATIDGPAEDGE